MIRQLLQEHITRAADRPGEVLVPPDSKLGDYSTNIAFVLAKEQAKKPAQVAQDLKSALESELFDICEVQALPNGYLNFFLKPEYLSQQLEEINQNQRYGSNNNGAGKKVIIEYSSINIAKPMHIGHLRSTLIGDALANIYEALGYEVIRWNYIGDWGTQFGKVIAGYKKWGQGKQDVTLSDMLEWYVKASKELTEGEGQAEFKKLEDGDQENRELWKKFCQASLEETKAQYKLLGIQKFDVFKGESSYESELKPIIEWLQKEGKIKESEGALIFDLEKYNLPVGMLQKTDGGTLYLTRDLASLGDRLKEYKPDKILYVVANQQALHFEQLFAIAKELKMDSAELIHVKFGMVLGEDGKKLATREGKVVLAKEVIEKIVDLAGTIVKQKNPALSDQEVHDTAHAVGVGALKYNDLKQHPYSDITFDWKAMLDLSGNSGPYLQYTYARLANILKKAGGYAAGDLTLLTEPTERALMKQLLDFPDAIEKCAEFYTLNALALYLYELAATANKFYELVHVLDDENEPRRHARLTLIQTVARTLKEGLNLLGIQTLDRI
jgi:arginyl-tRNA synthetase